MSLPVPAARSSTRRPGPRPSWLVEPVQRLGAGTRAAPARRRRRHPRRPSPSGARPRSSCVSVIVRRAGWDQAVGRARHATSEPSTSLPTVHFRPHPRTGARRSPATVETATRIRGLQEEPMPDDTTPEQPGDVPSGAGGSDSGVPESWDRATEAVPPTPALTPAPTPPDAARRHRPRRHPFHGERRYTTGRYPRHLRRRGWRVARPAQPAARAGGRRAGAPGQAAPRRAAPQFRPARLGHRPGRRWPSSSSGPASPWR